MVFLKELIFNSFYLMGGCGGLELISGVGVVVIKELIFNSFNFGGRCGGL